jgi:hypothetical protein
VEHFIVSEMLSAAAVANSFLVRKCGFGFSIPALTTWANHINPFTWEMGQ